MKIVADRYIPALESALEPLADEQVALQLCEPTAIDRALLHDCDALLVRSITPINAELLADTPVQFVGTATSGTDHIDHDWLNKQNIRLADAAGCNARPVAEYVLSNLCVMSEQRGCRLDELSVAIIGCGHVGSQLRQMLHCLGVSCRVNDPPLAEAGHADNDFCDLTTALRADVISLHVPLTDDGAHPTQHLLTSDRLESIHPGSLLINTARGEVVDERALKRLLRDGHLQLVADVWQNEPAIDAELAALAAIATPHIAGYSLDAKLRASARMCAALGEHFGLTLACGQPLPPAWQTLPLDADNLDELVRLAVLTSYDARTDATSLQRLAAIAGNRAAYFSGLRHDYALRREFSSLRLALAGRAREHAAVLKQLGFVVDLE